MGLLGDSWSDPQTLATLNLAAGLLGTGSLGEGMSRGLAGYTGSLNNATEQQLKQMQLASAAMQLRMNQGWLDTVQNGNFGGAQPTQPGLSAVPMGGLGSGTAGIMPTSPNAPVLPATGGAPSGPSGGPSGGDSSTGPNMNPAGLPPFLAKMMALTDRTGYFQSQAAAMAPTDLQKTLRASGASAADTQQALTANITKQNYINPTPIRPGGALRMPDGKIEFLPHVPDGFQPIKDANGNWQIDRVVGGLDATTQTAKAAAFGKLQGSLGQGVDASGNPTYFLGAPPGTVGASVPAAPGPAPGPAPGHAAPMTATNAALRAQVTGDMGADPAAIQREIAQSTASLAQVTDPASKQMLLDHIARMQQQAQAVSSDAQSGAIRPANAPGFNQFQEGLATAGAARYNNLIKEAADSPMRVDVLNKTINFSQQGVKTGPGADWQNNVKGLIANTPGIENFGWAKNWKEDSAHYQEMFKFMNQNALRAWQAAGGTGTDAQLEANTKANVNNGMFPQALQGVAQWAKAGELALQAKADASQKANISTSQKQTQFENTWRQNFDPVIFQLKTMTPEQRAAKYQSMKTTPDTSNPRISQYDAVLNKMGNLKLMGGL